MSETESEQRSLLGSGHLSGDDNDDVNQMELGNLNPITMLPTIPRQASHVRFLKVAMLGYNSLLFYNYINDIDCTRPAENIPSQGVRSWQNDLCLVEDVASLIGAFFVIGYMCICTGLFDRNLPNPSNAVTDTTTQSVSHNVANSSNGDTNSGLNRS